MYFNVIIIGGGLAGLTAAMHLRKEGLRVLVVEKNTYPNHKVCGEYVSNEVKPYLEYLGIDLDSVGVVAIDTLQISTRSGKAIKTKLPLGGFGISRYALDNLLYKNALELGVEFTFKTVADVLFDNDKFEITLSSNTKLVGNVVIGAFGKRSNLDKKLNRKFIQQKSPWLGVKCHYNYKDFPENLVALHNFYGGYGGLSKTEDGSVNFCYLTNFKSFQKHKSIQEFNESVVAKNPFLRDFLKNASPKFKKPLSIAQISFEKKKAIENHMLMCGDSAGLIHPLCGNGMAMAIHSAKIASDCIISYFNERHSRKVLEETYDLLWRKEFNSRLRMGRGIQKVLLSNSISETAIATIARSEKILQSMIKRTHGNPILV